MFLVKITVNLLNNAIQVPVLLIAFNYRIEGIMSEISTKMEFKGTSQRLDFVSYDKALNNYVTFFTGKAAPAIKLLPEIFGRDGR